MSRNTFQMDQESKCLKINETIKVLEDNMFELFYNLSIKSQDTKQLRRLFFQAIVTEKSSIMRTISNKWKSVLDFVEASNQESHSGDLWESCRRVEMKMSYLSH